MGNSSWGHRESDMTEHECAHTHTHTRMKQMANEHLLYNTGRGEEVQSVGFVLS